MYYPVCTCGYYGVPGHKSEFCPWYNPESSNPTMPEIYDSRPETIAHISRVQNLLSECITNLTDRAVAHDQSKLESPEKEAFDLLTPKLKKLTYGSEEYRATLREMKPALEHHYANNSHHPEHYPNGIEGMSLFDIIEMLVDWKAASERHADGSMAKSLEHNRARFNISDQLYNILCNTARELGLLEA